MLHYCNICNEFLDFKPMLYRKSACCPKCGSLERHRAMAIHLYHYLPKMHNANILHFSPEKCLTDLIMSAPSNYYGVYYDAQTKTGIDIRKLPYQDGFFDFIILNQILEHIDDDAQAVSELYRVAKPGAVVLLTVPLVHQYQNNIYRRIDNTCISHLHGIPSNKTFMPEKADTPTKSLDLYGQADHVRIYGIDSMKELLEKSGFNVHIAKPENYPHDFRMLLNIIDEIFICEKPDAPL